MSCVKIIHCLQLNQRIVYVLKQMFVRKPKDLSYTQLQHRIFLCNIECNKILSTASKYFRTCNIVHTKVMLDRKYIPHSWNGERLTYLKFVVCVDNLFANFFRITVKDFISYWKVLIFHLTVFVPPSLFLILW